MTEARVVTLGCRLNAFESEIIRQEAAAIGLRETVVVNTCAVTSEAVRQARQTIRKLRRQNPHSRIIVTGCAAQLDAETFSAMPEVDHVIGNHEKLDRHALGQTERAVAVSDIMEVRQTAGHLVHGFDGRVRAFAQVQQGCDHRCTFCIIPFARGPNRSMEPERIIDQVRHLIAGGFREVVLTGVDICSYGRESDGHPTLGALVRQILKDIPELPRLRLSSLDPAAIDDALFEALGDDPRLMPHWHLSLQAADDLVLKRMKRRHSRAMVHQVVERARTARPDMVFGADLIAGFPTETDQMFANTLSAVGEFGLTYLHVFPYSPRPGTPAARMPQVAKTIREARARQLREAGARAHDRFVHSRIGSTTDILVETERLGRCPYYTAVRLPSPATAGTIVRVRITGVCDHELTCEYAP